MPRITRRYLQPLQTDGTLLTPEAPRGEYTLVAGTRYFFVLPTEDTAFASVQLTGYTAALIITSATVEDTDHAPLDVPDSSTVVGEWVGEDPTTAFVGADGTGWTPANGVLAVAGGNLGGALWHIAETGAARTRLNVLVGATGGAVRVSCCGK